MKEAAGEANLTVVAIILIGVIVAVVTPIINSVMKNTKYSTCCQSLGGKLEGDSCTYYSGGQPVTKGKTEIVDEASGECKVPA